MKKSTLLCLLAFGITLPVSAAKVGQRKAAIGNALAVRAILGEASNQSDAAMLAIAGVIRNRGSLQGIYGLNNPVALHASAHLRARAARAWSQSATNNTAHGCKFFGCPADARYFVGKLHFKPVQTIGAITFYKP